MTPQVPDVLAPGKPGPVTLRDRIVKAAAYGGTRRVPSTEPASGSARA